MFSVLGWILEISLGLESAREKMAKSESIKTQTHTVSFGLFMGFIDILWILPVLSFISQLAETLSFKMIMN